MSNKYKIMKRVQSFQNIANLSDVIYTSSKINLYQYKQKINKIGDQLNFLKQFQYKKNKEASKKILIQLENNCCLLNLPYKDDYDFVIGKSAQDNDKYLINLKDINQLIREIEIYKNVSFIIPTIKNQYILLDDNIFKENQEKYDQITEIDPKKVRDFRRRLLVELAVYNGLRVENYRRMNKMSAAVNNTKKIIKKNKNLYQNMLLKESTNELITSVNSWSKNG